MPSLEIEDSRRYLTATSGLLTTLSRPNREHAELMTPDVIHIPALLHLSTSVTGPDLGGQLQRLISR
jgi:hypothetical protein